MLFFPHFLFILASIEKSSCSRSEQNAEELKLILEGKEFYYRLDQKHIFLSKVSDLTGSYLKVGENWENTIGSATEQAECSRLDAKKYYKDAFETKCQLYTNSPHDDVFSTYFVYTNKEVWDCTIKSGGVKFYRIVNELYGINVVKEIYYFDGTKISSAPTPVQSRNRAENEWTVKVKEVKYLEKTGSSSPIKYEGKVKLKGATVNDFVPSIFQPVYIIEVDKYINYEKEFLQEYMAKIYEANKGYRYQKYVNDIFKSAAIGSEGKTVRVGTKRLRFVGENKKTTFEKIIDAGDPEAANLYLEKFIPNCVIVASRNGEQWLETEETKSIGVVKTVNRDYFSVIAQEVWRCTYREDGKDKTLIRRVTDMVAAIPIKEIQYYSGISVWKYNLNENSKSVKIREVYYYEPPCHDRVVFVGDVELKKAAVVEGDAVLRKDILLYDTTHL